MTDYLNILILEDVKSDALLIDYQLRKAEFTYKTKFVETKKDYIKNIEYFKPDLILSDYNLPDISGLEALEIATKLSSDTPFIFVTGILNEKTAINFIKKGAWDYVLKDNLLRLIPAIESAIKLKKEKDNLKSAQKTLELSNAKYQDLYENAPDMYLSFDMETAVITQCNNTLSAITGYTKPEIIGHSIFEFYPNNISDRIKEELIPDILQTSEIKNADIQIIKKDKSIINGMLNAMVKYGDNGLIKSVRAVIRDVTERKQAEEALKESEEYFRALIENTTDVISVIDEKGNIKYESPSHKKILGYDKGFLIGKSAFEFVHPDDIEHIKQQFADLLQKPGKIEQVNFRFLHKDGTWLYIEGIGKNLLNIKGIKGIIVNYRDVTESKRAEKALQESEIKLRNIFENSTNIFFSHTPDHIITYISPQVKKILGYNPEEVLINRSELTSDNPVNEIGFQHTCKAIETAKPQKPYELELVHKNGKKVWVEVREAPLVEEGKTISIVGALVDITERKKANEELNKLSVAIRQSPITVVITDTEGNIEFANPKFKELTGYSSEEIMGKKLRLLKSGKHKNEFYKEILDTITGGKVWKGEFHNIKKNGELYWEDTIISPVRNTKGDITHFIALIEDITNKKYIEQKLKESEEHFRRLFEKSLIGMYLITPGGKIIRANKALYEMLGYNSFEEFAQINLGQQIDLTKYRKDFKAILGAKNYILGYESVWMSKKNQPIYVRESARKYIDETGQIFFEGTVENITEWKLADKALKDIHNFNEKIIKAGKLGYATFKENGDCISVNKSYADIVGATEEQILERNFKKLKNWETSGLIKKADKCLKEGTIAKIIIEAESSFKKDIWVEINLSRIYKNNEATLLVIIKDISSFLKAKKRQFQTKAEYINLIENVNVPVFGVNKNGIINEWNTTIEKLSGCEKHKVKGKNFIKLFCNKNDKKTYNYINNSLGGIEISNEEINLIIKSKKHLKLLVSTTIRRNINNEIDGIICMGQDITEIHNYKTELERRVEERTHKLIEALKKEKELGDLKSQFVSMASHEFRTPLAAISFAAGFVNKYWQKIDDNKRISKLEKIETQVKHMTHLLDDVLTLGKTENGKMKFEPKKINVIIFLINLIEEIQNINGNSHKIKFSFDDEDCIIVTDEKIARNIFNNLLTNAVKFSPNAGEVFLNLKSNDSEVIFELIDQGIGINHEDLEHIFTSFHRGKNVSTIQGTGLGLAIVKESIALMKGKIKVESKVGEGTKFTITLPKNYK